MADTVALGREWGVERRRNPKTPGRVLSTRGEFGGARGRAVRCARSALSSQFGQLASFAKPGVSAKVFRAGRSRDLVLLFFALSAVTSNRCTYHWCAARKFFAAFVPFSRLALIGSRFAEASIYPTGVVSLESGRSFRRPRLIGWIHGHAMCRCIRSSGNVLRCESRGDICCGNTNTKGGNGFEHGALLIAMGIHFRRGV